MAGEGLSLNGFLSKTMPTIQSEITQALQSAFGPQINLQPGSVFATLRDIFADRETSLWNLAQQCYNSQYVDTAIGAQLDNVAALTGTARLPATYSRSLSQLFFGTVGTIVPAGTLFSVLNNASAIFSLDSQVTLVAGANEVQTITFGNTPNAGAMVLTFGNLSTVSLPWSSSAASIQSAVQALAGFSNVTVTGSFAAGFTFTYAGLQGLQPYALFTVTTNTLNNSSVATSATVTETTLGVVQGQGTLTCVATGANVGPARTLTVINNPVSGLSSTTNSVDVVPGTAVETDAALRIRRKSQLQNAGAGTLESIRAKLLTVANVTQAIVFENQTLSVDGNSTAAKGIQCFVQGGTAQDIANIIWAVKPAGIATSGNLSQNITDSQGVVRAINYSRPVLVPIYVTVNITHNSSWPVDAVGGALYSAGIAQVVQAILNYGLTLTIGQNVLVNPKLLPAIADVVPGIQTITVFADITASPTNTNAILMAVNAIAQFSSGNILVNVT